MKPISKKDYIKKKPNRKETGHWEGKHWCECRTRKFKQWLGIKRYGHDAVLKEKMENDANG
jgi:hypothetical protein